AESRIGGIAENESTNVGCPIGISRECEIQTGGNLSPKTKPIRIDVARPGRNSISLRSGEGCTRQDEHPLPVGCAALALINGLGIEQGISIYIAVTASCREFVIQQNVLFLAFGLRFGRIHPPGIGTDAEK